MSNTPVDAILLLSFGGPDKPEDVMPFLRNVTRGRNVPDARLEKVAEHYHHFGGKSPINGQNIALMDALKTELRDGGHSLPLYWGNRNWHPLVQDTVVQMKQDGIQHALVFVTSAFGSYSGCRQYREDLANAQKHADPGAPQLTKLRHYFNHPGFTQTMVERTRDALQRTTRPTRLIFTAHSIPISMAERGPYVTQLRDAAATIASEVNHPSWDLVWQSRSGPPHIPWLEPDILDHIRTLHTQGASSATVVPLGFISDHMEVIYDLDTEAAELCDELGMEFIRGKTAGVHPRFLTTIRELIEEALDPDAPRPATGKLGPTITPCAPNCCLPR